MMNRLKRQIGKIDKNQNKADKIYRRIRKSRYITE